jgi:hypothetical protein
VFLQLTICFLEEKKMKLKLRFTTFLLNDFEKVHHLQNVKVSSPDNNS